MSYAVIRGRPVESQRYLDKILDAIIQDGGTRKTREQVNLSEVIYYCMKTNPGVVHTINGATGEKFTNELILKRAVSLARTITAMGVTEKTVIIMVRNHEHMSALYYAVLLAGAVPFMMEPGSTEYEIQHFLSLVSPCVVFCEPDRRDDVSKVASKSDVRPDVVAADGPSLDKFVQGHSDDLDSFQLPELHPEDDAIMLPTSGSTGLPKAAIMTHQGLVVQLPCTWQHHSKFPEPTRLVLLLSTAQWMTHTIIMTTCPVYQVPILLSPEKMTPEYVAKLAEKYRPTWTFAGPAMAAALGNAATSDQLMSFDSICIGGSPFAQETLNPLKDKLSPTALLANVYGLTETQGFVTMGTHGASLTTIGRILNILDYRIVNEDGKDVSKPYEKGEIYLKGKCILKGYLKNENAYNESVTSDGWLKTGDICYRDEEDQLYFANRIKLGFKYLNHHVNPEELEIAIGSLPGVKECVVCGADAGPAAAVVLLPENDVTREEIHQAVNSTLSDYKRLRGGIAFVSALPRTHNGKIRRTNCLQLIQELTTKGECF